jgi:3'(2'), 5'-bisphosphate nucleotidase
LTQDEKELAQIVVDVGNLLLQWRDSGLTQGVWQGSQLKAEADRRAHEELSKRLAEWRPGTAIVSEEDEQSLQNSRPQQYFLIDPLDGTASFAGGFEGFVCQAAWMKDQTPHLAAVVAPVRRAVYSAARGSGASKNGERIELSGGPHAKSLIDNYPSPGGLAAEAMQALNIEKYIESGSIGLKICRVADGESDLFLKSVVVRDWDVAPGQLILEEAGGRLSDINGFAYSYIGDYEREGLIAAGSESIWQQACAWQRKREANEQ